LACPPNLSPPRSGGGGSGEPGDGDPDETCTSHTTVTDTTVHCTLSASPGAHTMDTTCTTTQYQTTTGCSLTAIQTTKYESEGCPKVPPYVPPATNANGYLPLPGPGDPHGYIMNTGTFTWAAMSASPTAPRESGKPTPEPVKQGKASWTVQMWQEDMLTSSKPPTWRKVYSYYGYADNTHADCVSVPSWKYNTTDGLPAGMPNRIDNMNVYGDTCSFTRDGMKLHCNRFADATCWDATSDSYTCQWSSTLRQSVYSLFACTWS
jgi:hypothetical protein